MQVNTEERIVSKEIFKKLVFCCIALIGNPLTTTVHNMAINFEKIIPKTFTQ